MVTPWSFHIKLSSLISAGIFVVCCAGLGSSLWAQTAQYGPVQNTLNISVQAPAGVAVDGSRNLFIAGLGNGSGGGSAGLYEVLAAGGYTTTNSLASGSFYAPAAVAVDRSGNVFVADKGDGSGAHHAGVYEVLAVGGYTTVNPLASGSFYAPAGVAVDRSGNIFVADYGNGSGGNHAGVFEISGTAVTQLAAFTTFQAPDGVAVDALGNVFVADYGDGLGGSHAGFFEISGATVTQLAASNGFLAPSGVAVDANDNIFIADKSKATVNELLAAGGYTTVSSLGSGLSSPLGLALDWGDNVYIADSGNSRVEEVELAAADLGAVQVGNTSSAPVQVTFTFNSAVNLDQTTPFNVLTQGVTGLDFTVTNGSTGNCSGSYSYGNSCTVSVTFSPHFAGTRYGAVVLYGPSGPIATANLYGFGIAPQLAFSPGARSLMASGVNKPWALTVDAGGTVFVTSNQDGAVEKIALSNGSYSAPAPIFSGLASPTGVALDGSGNIFVADSSLGIIKAVPSQGTYTPTSIAGINGLAGIAVDQFGNLYSADASTGAVYKETLSNGSYTQTAIGTGLINPTGIVVDGNGNVFVTEYGRGTVDKLTPFNGSYSQAVVDSGFSHPEGIALDASGSLYISSADVSSLYKETPTSNGSYSRSAIATNINPQPWWATIDASGNLYFTANNSNPSDGIYKIDAVDAPTLSFPTPTALGNFDSTDNPEAATLWNIGNANLTWPVPSVGNSNPSFSSNSAFSLDSSTTCPNLSSSSTLGTEAPGGSCTYAVDFTPNISGANSGALMLTDNNLNSANASQSISLSGIALGSAATPVFTPATGTYTSVQSLTITDAIPGATIYFTTDGSTPTTGSTKYTSAITVSSTETIKAIAVASGYSQSAVASAAYTINLPAAATPTFSPAAGTYTSIKSVTISDTTTGATIYFTTDGSTPTTSSTQYTSAITVSSTETIKAIAVASGYSQSAVGSAAYTINLPAVATPTFSPAAGTYTSIKSVTIADTTTGATVYYTIDGSTPTTSSTQYTSAISVSTTETIKAIAVAAGHSQSAVALAAYTINLPAAATPTFSPKAGTYTSIQSVTIADRTSGATIYYTTDGSTPTTSSTEYTSAISVSATETIEAIAVATGHSQSAVASAAYTINLSAAATPTFSPVAGTYTSTQTVSIADKTSGATIYYTTNGSTPTTSSAQYTSAISVSATETIKAIAVATGHSESAVASAAYTINLSAAATPTFSPTAGTYTSTQTVSIADTTTGATVYYTTNGSTPTTSSSVYGAPITVSSTQTLKAIAVASGYSQSAVASAVYTINLTSATPTFTPAAGTYTSIQSVTISDTTTGATIYYTTNGSTPTTSSTQYTSAISVSATETIKAIAVATGYSQSAVASAAYTINLSAAATPTFTPAAGTYTSIQSVTISDTTTGATIYYTTNGSTPTTSSTQYTSAVPVSATETIKAIAVATGYSQSAVASAAYTINPPAATPTFTPAAGTYTFIQSVTLADSTTGATIYYTTNGTTPTTSSSIYGTPITVSSSETLEAIAVASGYSQSAIAAAPYTINLTAAIPTFTPPSPYTGVGTTVTISDSTSGATIYFCQDTTNTCIPSTPGSAVLFSTTGYIRAQAALSGYTPSAIASWSGTYTPPTVAIPTFAPLSPYTGVGTTVTISDSTSGATIYFCQDTTNTCIPSTPGSAVLFSTTGYIRAQAALSGYSPSAIASWSGTYTPPTVAIPTFTPPSPYTGVGTTVTISDSTSGATIYFCQDTTNTCIPSTPGTTVLFSTTGYIRAQAALSGYTPSEIASWSGTYSPQIYIVKDSAVTPCTGSATSGKSVACALSNLTAGDLIVCPFVYDAGPYAAYESTISDSANGLYLNASESKMSGGGKSFSGYGAFGTAYRENVAAGSDTVTMAVSASTDVISVGCSAYMNARTTRALDGAFWLLEDQTASTSNPSAGAVISPTGDGELVFGNLVPSTVTPTAGTNYTLISQITSGINLMYPEYWPQTTATSTNCPYVESAGTWDDLCLAFLPASASPGVTPFQGLFTNFAGLTNDSVPTVASLNSSTYSNQIYSWDTSNITHSALKATNSTGPTNSLLTPIWVGGVQQTGSGGMDLHYTTGRGGDYLLLTPAGVPTQAWLRYDFQTTLPQNDPWNNWYDQPSVQVNTSGGSGGVGPSIIANGSAIYVQLECYNAQTGTPTYSTNDSSPVSLPHAGAIAVSANTQYSFVVYASATTGSGTLNVYDSGGTQVGSISCSLGKLTSTGIGASIGVPGSETESTGHDFWWRNVQFSTRQAPLP